MAKISVVIPTINEEKTIGEVISRIRKVCDAEIIIVDTDSRDRTREIAQQMGAKVIQEPRRGYGVAYKTGFNAATGDILVGIDGDATYPPEIIAPALDILELDDIDFISCDRMTLRTERNYTMLHFVGNSILNVTIRILFKYRIVDSQSGMWIFRKSLYEKMSHLSDGMSFSQDLKIEAMKHGTLIEIPVKYGIRITKPKLRTWNDGFSNLFQIFVKRVKK